MTKEEHSLIANSGIHVIPLSLSIDTQGKFKMWYREWYDAKGGEWRLESVYEHHTEEGDIYYYDKSQLSKGGYLVDTSVAINPSELRADGITPLRINDTNCSGVEGDIFKMTFSDGNNKMSCLENVWLPAPYFLKQTRRRFKFGPLNWSRFKIVPNGEGDERRRSYNVLLAFDTRAKYGTGDRYDECPTFADEYKNDMLFELCSDEFLLMDYCTNNVKYSYIDDYLFHLVHPKLRNMSQIKGNNVHRTAYSVTYMFLVNYIVQKQAFPPIRLYRDRDVEANDIDMIIDIGNSRTTALLVGDSSTFNNVRPLELTDFTDILAEDGERLTINRHSEPFDMRVAFRQADFGNFGIADSKQFVYPSLVRLGSEAGTLLREAANIAGDKALCTYSSPKRYLWDGNPSKEEWRYVVLRGEEGGGTLNLRGITNQLKSDGKVDQDGQGGVSFHYSRRSLMTFSFLEMLAQAKMQINGENFRSAQQDSIASPKPQRIKRIIVTCPTAMSKMEREALVQCAKDAVTIAENFDKNDAGEAGYKSPHTEVIPSTRSRNNDETRWYYDEATCTQLVYMYGELGYKYKGCSDEFFRLYGKTSPGDEGKSITIGSIDIGAGTSDMMISKYAYGKGHVTMITPDPLFYDSFYFAGDDMLSSLIKNVMLLDRNNALGRGCENLSNKEYRQRIKDFFGRDYNMQSTRDRALRRDFNIQYSVPLMCYFLELLSRDSKDCIVHYSDVFTDTAPNESVISGFKEKMGVDITNLSWKYNSKTVADTVRAEFEPLIKKVATIMHSFGCDIILLSGRPASLAPIREIFLKYYPVSPNRLIVLNNYYVGDWYPFCENTGYIRNAKTIVAMGGVIACYATVLSRMDKFALDLSKLNKNLVSTVNYIGAQDGYVSANYIITPDNNHGDIVMTSLPTMLNVRQLEMVSYPARTLYRIDFNRHKIADRIRKNAYFDGGIPPTTGRVDVLVKEAVDSMRIRMPFKATIEKDDQDKEDLYITNIVDNAGNDIADSNIEIHIQSLGTNEQYWLDTGEFDF